MSEVQGTYGMGPVVPRGICGACGHPAESHGSRADLCEFGARGGCQVGVYVGRGFGRRVEVCGCDVARVELEQRV